MSGWIGVDFDGTLAHYEGWQGATVFGKPIPAMVQRVKNWLARGYEVRIVTARVSKQEGVDTAAVFFALNEWVKQHIGMSLPIVDNKDFAMIELWDDRVVQVVQNTGEPVPGQVSRTEGPPL